jgi:hypothetical protein
VPHTWAPSRRACGTARARPAGVIATRTRGRHSACSSRRDREGPPAAHTIGHRARSPPPAPAGEGGRVARTVASRECILVYVLHNLVPVEEGVTVSSSFPFAPNRTDNAAHSISDQTSLHSIGSQNVNQIGIGELTQITLQNLERSKICGSTLSHC